MITLALFCAMLVLSFVRYIMFRLNRKRLEKLIEEFPGPKSFPFIGSMHMFIGTPTDVLRRGKKLFEFESPFRIWLLHKPIVIIFDPENFQIIANKALQKGDGYTFIKDFLGEGLITASGDKWKKNRRLLNPAFNPHLLHKYFINVFNEENERLLKVLDAEAEKKKQFDLWPHLIHCTMNTISLTAMNYRDELEKGVSQYGESMLEASLLVTQRIYKPWLHPQILYRLYKRLSGYDRTLDYVHTLPKKIIERKKKELEHVTKTGTDLNANKVKDRKAKTFLDILINSPESKLHFSDDQLADEVTTIMMAGSETTALTVCTTLLMLAMNQRYQDQVHEEIQNVFGDDDKTADLNQLNQLTFLDQCIKETLRRYTVAPFIFRNITEDITLKDGKILPAGTTVCLAIAMLHINPKVFSNPKEWNPNNFAPYEIQNRHQCSFVPFSNGPRSCIGAKYAQLSIKVMLVTLLRRYRFTTDMKMKDYKPSFDIVLRNLSGYNVKIERRQKI